MGISIVQVDAFTDRPFAGNPAAVCLLPGPREEEWMQRVAAEMNLSETAFLDPRPEGFNLRWFTPATEVDLCGHATLASAHVLWESGVLDEVEEAVFETRSGRLSAVRRGSWIEMDFPSDPAAPAEPPEELSACLGRRGRAYRHGRLYGLLELADEGEVRALRPDFGCLARTVPEGLIVTAAAEAPEYDFVSRFFAPALGVDEDPVTGSAHCSLGPFWSERLDRQELVGFQASERGGVVRVRVAGERAILAGRAVTVLRGELL